MPVELETKPWTSVWSGCSENSDSVLNLANSPFLIKTKISSRILIARMMVSHLLNDPI